LLKAAFFFSSIFFNLLSPVFYLHSQVDVIYEKKKPNQTHKCKLLFPLWWRRSPPSTPTSILGHPDNTDRCSYREIPGPALCQASRDSRCDLYGRLPFFSLPLCDSDWAVGGGRRVGEGGCAFPNRWGFTPVGSNVLTQAFLGVQYEKLDEARFSVVPFAVRGS